MPHSDEVLGLLAATAPITLVVLGASPAVYVAPTNGTVTVQGGTVSLLELGRNAAFVSLGVVAGPVTMRRGDRLRVTYVVAPTVNLFPG